MLDHRENKGARGRFEFLSSLYPLVKSVFVIEEGFVWTCEEEAQRRLAMSTYAYCVKALEMWIWKQLNNWKAYFC